ncbi:radical SAM protein, partial [bacterium]|nr:radical SAM protein [candidate division CSSED10-310 bacterium]
GVTAALQLAEGDTCLVPGVAVNEYIRPAFHLYDKLDYVVLNTSTGCPFRCPFCASHLLSQGFHQRETDDVVGEILHWHRASKVRHVAFYDDALLWKHESHLVPILEKLNEQQLEIQLHTPNGIHPKYMDQELAALMYHSGFSTLRLSYESRDPKRQQEMGGKVSDDELQHAVWALKKTGFDATQISSYVLMGLPGQTIEEIVDSLLFVLGLGIPVSLASFSPIPGTQSWQDAIERGDIKSDIDPLLTNNSIFPLCKNLDIYNVLTSICQMANESNLILKKGENPFNNSLIMNSLRTVVKSHGHETID